jgi:hypothetical protein
MVIIQDNGWYSDMELCFYQRTYSGLVWYRIKANEIGESFK